jgi:hypothetical protein
VSRPNLDQILQQYQTPEDSMVKYSPRLGGMIDIPFLGSNTITRTEAELLDELSATKPAIEVIGFLKAQNLAYEESKSRYVGLATPPEGLSEKEGVRWIFNDGHRDAHRHAYWSAELTKRFGPEFAEKFTTAHEAIPNASPHREAMDLYNNEVGIRIAVRNPDASSKELADLVHKAAIEGELVVIDKNGNLAWSDQVLVGQHGTAKKLYLPDEQKVEMHSERRGNMQDASTDERANLDPRVTSIYQACSKGVDALDAQMGRGSDQASACMKASLAHLAMANGLKRVDHVLLSQQASGVSAGQHVFVVQGDPANPAHLRAHMPTEIAVKTPEETSLREMALAANAPARQAELSQQQEEVLRRAQPSQAGLG